MDPVSLILAALLAGATESARAAAGAAVQDAYAGLRDAIKRRLAGSPPAAAAVEEYVQDPDSWRPALETYLRKAEVHKDDKVLQAAEKVLTATDPEGARAGKYHVTLTGARGAQVGDGNTQTNYFGGGSG